MSRPFNPTGEPASFYDYNPYSNPGKCGLEILGVLEDPGANYSFDTVVVWIDLATSDLYAARDSGCSCPSPFEEFHETGQLIRVQSWDDVEGLIQGGYVTYDSADRFVLRRKVESYLGGMSLANEAVAAFERELCDDVEVTAAEIEAVAQVIVGHLEDRVADLEEDLATARVFNDQYLQIIREQGEFIQGLRVALANFTDRERGGRF
jgi:hypothetical protein